MTGTLAHRSVSEVGTPPGREITLDEFFADHDDARALYAFVRAALEAIGEIDDEVRALLAEAWREAG